MSRAKGSYNGAPVPKSDLKKLTKVLQADRQRVEQTVIYQLQYIGEACVKKARECGSYNDITGNLRSSIGYVIVNNGKVVVRGGAQRFGGSQGSGARGVSEGKKLLAKLTSEFPTGIVLIVCAGMEYAVYVEDIYGKDVLTSAQFECDRLMRTLVGRLLNRK